MKENILSLYHNIGQWDGGIQTDHLYKRKAREEKEQNKLEVWNTSNLYIFQILKFLFSYIR